MPHLTYCRLSQMPTGGNYGGPELPAFSLRGQNFARPPGAEPCRLVGVSSGNRKGAVPEVCVAGHRCGWDAACQLPGARGGVCVCARQPRQGSAYGREIKVGHVHHAQNVVHAELVLGVGQLHRGHQAAHGGHDGLKEIRRGSGAALPARGGGRGPRSEGKPAHVLQWPPSGCF